MPERLQGLIVKEQSGFYWVEAEDRATYMCELRGRLKEEAKSSDIAAIGDRASISLRREEGTDVLMGVIEELAPSRWSSPTPTARFLSSRPPSQRQT